ncbi:MAG: hypothetical protein A2140_02690 [Candidatus Muproteobacteria bacterium RBG_16_62_13]|uniref:Uncharacterized protein n=1 Tax=Candidatus Muproteobacteria bacterium RBG_16_62_13 TaxID=1817756 RepID=A0A1F6T4C8_9PROT|nr:MAG: hypothetical protein A2140_02690 [Candidatus Muproteobacteria bacterium RBG_16_62_13]
MRKYVLTDAEGVTALGTKLQPGKLVQDTRQKVDLMTKLVGCGSDTPLLATLISSMLSAQARLFQINCWTVSVDPRQPSSYTVVKEVQPVPSVHLEHKLAFGLHVALALGSDRDFRSWAQSWLDETDRSPDTAKTLLKAEEKEKEAAGELEALTAWGESGTDDTIGHDMDELAERCGHLVRAAILFPDSSKADEVAQLISLALANLASAAGKVNLPALAEQTLASAQQNTRSAANG